YLSVLQHLHQGSVVTKITSDQVTPVSWPTSPKSLWRSPGFMPGGLSSVSATKVACQGESCFVLWNDLGSIHVPTRVSRVTAGQVADVPLTVLPPDDNDSPVDSPVCGTEIAASAAGALVAGVRGVSQLRVQPIGPTGPGAVRDL